MSDDADLSDPFLATVIKEVREMRELLEADEARNRGARLADDHFCPSCGERGHLYTCRRCSQDLYGGGK